MKKWSKAFSVLLIVSALIFSGFSSVSAEENNVPNIRIGVVPAVESLTVGGTGDFDVVDKVTGEVLFEGSNEELTIELGESAVSKTNYRLQVSFTTSNA